jgi:hypothetical protein
MALFTQLGADTSYAYILGALFVMGLGMGATMMPIMSAALQTLTDHNIARGSTLMNITQQVAASIGTALFSVILTNELTDSPEVAAGAALAEAGGDPGAVAAIAERLGVSPDQLQALAAQAPAAMADAFATVFVVGTILVDWCLIPAFFLPRKPAEEPVDPTVLASH